MQDDVLSSHLRQHIIIPRKATFYGARSLSITTRSMMTLRKCDNQHNAYAECHYTECVIQHNGIEHNNIQHKKYKATLSIMTALLC